jgi:hypothetical protein
VQRCPAWGGGDKTGDALRREGQTSGLGCAASSSSGSGSVPSGLPLIADECICAGSEMIDVVPRTPLDSLGAAQDSEAGRHSAYRPRPAEPSVQRPPGPLVDRTRRARLAARLQRQPNASLDHRTNSSYLFGPPMAAKALLPRGKNSRNEISVKPGLAQTHPEVSPQIGRLT